ncbi:MAG: methylenetetrahydrofolate reductase [Sulfurospirillaceae bacterium]|nr:methylenetetrahydrofolate reductase [Sulfurospirillaceae bacterium]
MLKEKILSRSNGILLYGITPPKKTHTCEEIEAISSLHVERLNALKIDGVVLYDIQDEKERTTQERPFPFIETLDSYYYAQKYLQKLNKPVIIYKAVGKYSQDEFKSWLKDSIGKTSYSVFVGAASSGQKVNTSIQEAYKLKQEINNGLILGGIAIPERHSIKHDEHVRIFSKIDSGCEFFISQAVYDLKAAKKLIDDYVDYALEKNRQTKPIIFTLTPCGSIKTLEFMKWLGINIPEYLEQKLINSEDILHESVELILDIFKNLYMYGKQKGVAVGCNVESVAVRKAEIEASISLVEDIRKIIEEN